MTVLYAGLVQTMLHMDLAMYLVVSSNSGPHGVRILRTPLITRTGD